jgi:hypothetical protein
MNNQDTGEFVAKTLLWIAVAMLTILLIGLLGCANIDRALWDTLGRIQTP